MTICIGALAANGDAIVCVSDKGLSYGPGIQWDSDSTKIVPIGSYGAQALIAGNEIMISRVLSRLDKVPDLGGDVLSAISQCEAIYKSAEEEVLEAVFLRPNLLSASDYKRAVTKPDINPFIRELTGQMADERRRQDYVSCEILLCGFDSNKKSFLLSLRSPGLVTDLTHTGNGAVGSGFERAISRLLWSGWERKHSIDRVLYDTFDAKADAEMVPTVGVSWDAVILTADGAVIVDKEVKELVERAWAHLTRSPWESHDPDSDLPEPPLDWQARLSKYAKSVLKRPAHTLRASARSPS